MTIKASDAAVAGADADALDRWLTWHRAREEADRRRAAAVVEADRARDEAYAEADRAYERAKREAEWP